MAKSKDVGRRSIAYVAVDAGPSATLAALAAKLPGELVVDVAGWQARCGAERTSLLICGTSDSDLGRKAEAGARGFARNAGIPCAVLEDFAGNYGCVPGTTPALVWVESEFAGRLARSQDPSIFLHVGPNIRYDGLRRRLDQLRSAHTETANSILWIGQPETNDGIRTLHRLLPVLAARSVRVWLRAHPRDAGYGWGAYAGLAVEDVTSLPLEECLARRPRLVVTQFSSVAIEAGFWGIPSLNVLFPDAGGRTLAAKKGYSVPPWCEQGAAFLIVNEEDTKKVLDRALRSGDARNAAMQAFDRYFKVREEGAPMVINLLYNQGLL